MRTQSSDTHPEVERVLIALLRQKGVTRRFQLTASLSHSMMIGGPLARQQQQPELTEADALFESVERSLGQSLTTELRLVAERRQVLPAFATVDLAATLFPVMQALEKMSITCALTGSLARSLYGMQRAAFQIDVLADLGNVDATLLHELLPFTFYTRHAAIEAALASRSSFLTIHLPSLFTVRIAWPQTDLDELAMFARARRLLLIEGKPVLPVLAPEDVSLLALAEIQQEQAELVRQGSSQEPDDLWNELLGVLKVQGPELDLSQIERCAHRLGLSNEMQRAFVDAGLRE